MSETWRRTHLPEIVAELARRPGHEAVRTHLTELLRHGFGANYHALDHEVRLPEVHGRADTLFGATVFEFKRDLRRELADVESRLPDYLAERERQTGRRFVGIATDGAIWIAFELRGGRLVEFGRHETRPDRPDALLHWLDPVLSDRDDLPPEPLTVQRELGRDSLAFGRAYGMLTALWSGLRDHPEVMLKRQLWDRLLREVYGTAVGDDGLFLQHTYLTVVAKTVAVRVLDLPADDPAAILSGRALAEAGIQGAVEGDFFDWILQAPEGADLVRRVARTTGRFRLRDVKADVLKALYESLIDPTQRHDLGEYYTPDWLAAKLVKSVFTEPLTERLLDPACGSGTFLFHAVRQVLAAAKRAGWPAERAITACAERVRGLDVHPVAVIIARVTWLLALGDSVMQRSGDLHVPVFLGDALQWNLHELGDGRDMTFDVPDEPPLRVPFGFAQDQAKFEPGLQALTLGLRDDASPAEVTRRLSRIHGVTPADANAMTETFGRLQALYKSGRDGIWPYVMRNLVRPLWLARGDQLSDVVVGNPPWVAYRHLSAEMKNRLRDASRDMNLWIGGKLATQQDLSALFWARAARFYLKPGGRIGFVLPYAALNRPAFAGLRRGDFRTCAVAIGEAWSFDEHVQPLFPVPACVLIGERKLAGLLPSQVTRFAGDLPRRDANEAEADRALTRSLDAWPPAPTLSGASPYRARFQNGATIYPRRFFLVERESAGRLGQNPSAPRVRGKTSGLDKRPWSAITPPVGPVEADFLRFVILGETIAPYRLLDPALAVVPVEDGAVLDARAAAAGGHRHLAAWLREVEAHWRQFSNQRADRQPRMTLVQQLDHMRKLSSQFPPRAIRVAYAKAGTLPAACIVRDPSMIIDHKAYWASVRGTEEARYLCAVLNSETARVRIAPMQSRGQGGARDFDNLIWELRIPDYTSRNPLHRRLAYAAGIAEGVAATVELDANSHFTRQRRAIRDALAADGVAGRIDTLVARLLDAPASDRALEV